MKKITISLFVVLFSAISLFAQNRKITIEDIYGRGIFVPSSVYGLRSMNDGLTYTTLEDRGTKIVKHSYKNTNDHTTILNIKDLRSIKLKYISDYQFSKDETKILLMTNKERLYRRSFFADYYIWNTITKKLTPLSESGRERLATFSPDGEKIAYVKDYNIFIYNTKFETTTQITSDGKFNEIQNGTPDWVNEEEFGYNRAFRWSPKSTSLAYIKFNEGHVKMFNMTIFKGEKPSYRFNALYPANYAYKYPKAGEENSYISVHVYDLKGRTTETMDIGENKDIYVPRIRWTTDDNRLGIFRLNRHQNKFDVLLANKKTGNTELLFTEKNKYYVSEDIFDDFSFLQDGKHFVTTSERSGFNHIYLYDMQGNLVRQITKGDWDVTNFDGFDEKKKKFYYTAAAVSPMEREVYRIDFKGEKLEKLSTKKGTNSAKFSKGYKYFINYFSNVKTPTYVTLHDSKGRQIRVLEDNKEYVSNIKPFDLCIKEFIQVPSAKKGLMLNAWIIKPHNFNPNKKYPVYITQYSGPNSQEVLNTWKVGWHEFLAQEGFIVISIDPRGTGARGEEFRKCTYMQLGKIESEDQIAAAKYLRTLPYIDQNNIAIWGWSYGGYMSSLCLAKAPYVFKSAIAVAPVVNWRFYDTIYTERYMRTPQENPEGYDDNSPINHIQEIKGGDLLLIHGTADDNVHHQNALELAEKLVQADKQFEMQIYTNRNHSIYGGYTRIHLYKRFLKFLKEQLRK